MKRPRQLLPLEDAIQAAIVQLLRLSADRRTIFLHIPNGMYASAKIGARFVKLGMLPGAPDLLVITPDGRSHFMEVKTAGGYQREPQKAFQARCAVLHLNYAIVRSLRDAEEVLTAWGALRTVERRAA